MYYITFQQIEAFLATARLQNISKAAEHLYMTQPSLTKLLQRFESGVGFQVFTRTNKGATLTPQGRYLFDALDKLYGNMNRAIKMAREFELESKKILKIAAPITFDVAGDYSLLKNYLRDYSEKHPDTELSTRLCDFFEAQRLLEFGEVDLAFMYDFSLTGIPDIKSRRMSEYKLHLVISAHHPLASYDVIPPEKLSKLTFFLLPQSEKDNAKTRAIDRCRENGFIPKQVEFVDNFMTLLHKLREMRGISICGKLKYVDDIKHYPLNLFQNRAHIVVAWYDDKLTKSAKEFINMLPEADE